MIINIRGTSGSGKSTIIREVMKLGINKYNWEPDWGWIRKNFSIHPPLDEKTGLPKKRRQPWGYLLEMGATFNRNLVVLGHYETACGGCDTLPNFDLGFAMVQEAHHRTYDVLFEGLLYSADAERTLKLHKAGLPMRVIGLDTPLQVCIDSINARRSQSKRAAKAREKGEELKGVNPDNTESKHKGTQSTMRKLKDAGVIAEWHSRGTALGRIIEMLAKPVELKPTLAESLEQTLNESKMHSQELMGAAMQEQAARDAGELADDEAYLG